MENNPSRGRKNFNPEREAAAVGKGGWTDAGAGATLIFQEKFQGQALGSERRARPDNSMVELARGEEIC